MVKSSKNIKSFKEKITTVLKNKRPSTKHSKRVAKKPTGKKRPMKKHSKHTSQKNNAKSTIQLKSLEELKSYIEEEHKKGKVSPSNYSNLIKSTNELKEKILSGAANSVLQKMSEELKKQWRESHEDYQPKHAEKKSEVKLTHHKVHHVAHQAKHINPSSTTKSVVVNHKMHKKNHKSHAVHHERNNEPNEAQEPYRNKGNFRTDKDIAMDFATKIHKKFDHLIKASVLFGSQTTGEIKPGSDIDIVLVIDDAAINWDLELTSWYREELAKVIAEQNYGRDLHINTVRLTTWWRDLLHGDPVILNIVRQGQVLIDLAGFFNPIKSLLIQGKIHATPEAVYSALQRSPQHLTRSRLALLGAIEGVYWCMVEAAQAALITLGKLPPTPEHVTKMLHESFVEAGVLKSDYVKWYRDIYILHKQISHGEINQVEAKEIEAWQKRAEEFMKTMVVIIDRLLESRKNQK